MFDFSIIFARKLGIPDFSKMLFTITYLALADRFLRKGLLLFDIYFYFLANE